MNTELLELAESALGTLAGEVVFVGGATIGLWISDPAAPAFRPTDDVDVVVEVVTRSDFDDFQARLRGAGFRHDRDSGVICRFRYPGSALVLDAMPSEPSILGFASRWQAAAIPGAVRWRLGSGAEIRVASPGYLLAMKLEAFKDRGNGDFLGSRDFGDVVALIDGRRELVSEVASASADLRRYVGNETHELLQAPRLRDGLASAVLPDAASQQRIELVVLPALRALAALRAP